MCKISYRGYTNKNTYLRNQNLHTITDIIGGDTRQRFIHTACHIVLAVLSEVRETMLIHQYTVPNHGTHGCQHAGGKTTCFKCRPQSVLGTIKNGYCTRHNYILENLREYLPTQSTSIDAGLMTHTDSDWSISSKFGILVER